MGVCARAYTSTSSELVCAPWPRRPTDPGKTLPGALPAEGMGLFLPLWAGQGQGKGVCGCVEASGCFCVPLLAEYLERVYICVCTCLCLSSLFHLRGSVWQVVTHLKFCALYLSLWVSCVREHGLGR